jgi:predicted metal-dependent peptidase
MKFSRVVGKIDPKLVTEAENKLGKVFLELGVRYDNEHVGSGMGGDPLIFSLMYPVDHVCTMNIPTAATDGKRFYWNPKFVLKHSIKGLRIVCGHEAWHALYMHPSRRGSRNPKLWNIAVDYIVNGTVMEDFKTRKKDPAVEFTKNLGRYMTLSNFCELIKDPFAKIPGFEDLNPTIEDPNAPQVELPAPNEDRELTPAERKLLEKREKGVKFYYGDPALEEDMKRPEKIYDLLYKLLPKCPKCGRLGIYKKPDKKGSKSQPGQGKQDKQSQDKQEGQGQQGEKPQPGDGQDKQDGQGQKPGDQHNHGGDQPCDCGDQGQHGQQPGNGQGQSCNGDQPCDNCGGGVDIFGLGGTVDEHMDSEESEEKLAKRISDAMEAARKLAGHVPAALEDELGKLTAPKVTWQDIIRTRLLRARAGNGRNDWTRFRTRPMFSGLLVPKRKNYYAHFGCLLDTSGSMSKDDMAFGLSQLTSLDERSEGTIVPADADIYWEDATKVKKADAESISRVKVVGRGGTKYAEFFTDYEQHIGKCDFLIVVSDGFLLDSDIAEMKHPGIDVIWLITSGSAFNPPFGRAFDLRA